MNFKFVMGPAGVVFHNLVVPYEDVYIVDAQFRVRTIASGIAYKKQIGEGYSRVGFAQDPSRPDISPSSAYRDWGVRHAQHVNHALVYMYPERGSVFFFPFNTTAMCVIRMRVFPVPPVPGSIEGLLGGLSPQG